MFEIIFGRVIDIPIIVYGPHMIYFICSHVQLPERDIRCARFFFVLIDLFMLRIDHEFLDS